MLRRLRQRNEWRFFAILPNAAPALAAAWWTALVLRGILPAALAIATGLVTGAVQRGGGLAMLLALARRR